MEWTELVVETTLEASDAVVNILMENGAGGVQFDDSQGDDDLRIITYFPESEPVAELSRDLAQRVRKLSDFGLNPGRAEVSVKTDDDSGWVDAWKKYYHPVRLTRYLTIAPSWEEYEPESADELVIRLDPGKAFGTGTHPTTRLALLGLEEVVRGGETMIDVGTGSGVLGIAACRMGVGDVWAYDVDDEAIRACDVNLKLNPDVREKIHVAANDLLKGIDRKVDIICANILAEIIVPLVPQAFSCLNDGGIFITSGIISDKCGLIRDTLTANGFVIDRVSQMKDWFSIVAHRPGEDEE